MPHGALVSGHIQGTPRNTHGSWRTHVAEYACSTCTVRRSKHSSALSGSVEHGPWELIVYACLQIKDACQGQLACSFRAWGPYFKGADPCYNTVKYAEVGVTSEHGPFMVEACGNRCITTVSNVKMQQFAPCLRRPMQRATRW